MQNSNELAGIKAKIKALAAKTVENGCTEFEAMSAMAMVGRLLSQYNLTMTEIDVREQTCTTLTIKTGRAQHHAVNYTLSALSALFNAKVWYSKARWTTKEISYNFFGHTDDMDMINYLYHVIVKAIDNETNTFKLSAIYEKSQARKGAFASFQRGMTHRLSDRLRQMVKESEDAAKEMEAATEANNTTEGKSSDSRALIVLKGQLIEEEFKALNMKIGKASSAPRVKDYSAYSSGQEAANTVNLNRPVTNESETYARLSAV